MYKRILVVDDEKRVAFLLQQSLKSLGQGYEILTAQTGQEAVARIREKPFDLVITDTRLRDMGGLQLTNTIKALAPDTRVILMTAYNSHELEAEARRLSVYGYLTKPFPIEEIKRITREALQIA
jgi:two-component system response regulator HydG